MWVIYKSVSSGYAYIISKNRGLINIPETGWLISDDGWQEDNSLSVTGRNILSSVETTSIYNITEGEPTYPDTVTVSSRGGAAHPQCSSLGVYKITNQTYTGRPVWKIMADYDTFLFYQGNIKYIRGI